MPRAAARLDAPDARRHVVARGIERHSIFRNDVDRNDFLGPPCSLEYDRQLSLYAWSLMSNHLHLSRRTRATG